MSNQRLMKAKEKAGDGYAKTNAIGGGGGSARKLRHLQQELQDECLATKRARCSRTARSLRSLVTVTGMTLTDVRILELMVRYFRCLPRNVSLRPRVLCPLFPARSSRWT